MIAAGANAVLDVVDDAGFLADVAELAASGCARGLASARPGDVRGRGLMLAFEHRRRARRSRGARCSRSGSCVNATGPTTIRLLPPLTVSDGEIDEAVARIAAALW